MNPSKKYLIAYGKIWQKQSKKDPGDQQSVSFQHALSLNAGQSRFPPRPKQPLPPFPPLPPLPIPQQPTLPHIFPPQPATSNGTVVNIWAQDPSVSLTMGLMILPIFLPDGLPPNLQGDDIRVDTGFSGIAFDTNRNVLLTPQSNFILFDAVSVYATVKMVKTMYENSLGMEIIPRWGKSSALTIVMDDDEDANAYYDASRKCLIFCHFKDVRTNQVVYTRQMMDVVTHEAGHYILDSLKPLYLTTNHLQTGAFHEAFGDSTTLLLLLHNFTFCNHIILATKGNLHTSSFFSNFAEQFGSAHLRKTNGLRNADDDMKMSQVAQQVHDMSRVLVGIIFDVLCDIFDLMKEDKRKKQNLRSLSGDQLAAVLFEVGEKMRFLLIQATVRAPDNEITFKIFLQKVVDIEVDVRIKTILVNIANARGITLTPLI